jgi:acetyltransferase-like isoleucine patch superfamily enzyme
MMSVIRVEANEMTQIKYRVWLFLHGLKFLWILLVGRIPSHAARKWMYRSLGMKIGRRTSIYMGGEIRHPAAISIGDNTIIGHGVILDGRHGISIGNNVNFSTGVWIWTVQHDHTDPGFRDVGGPVVIGDHAWISCRTVILPGITIGEGAVVAAGAVVTKDVAPYTVVGGVPAKKIADRPRELKYCLGDGLPIPFV